MSPVITPFLASTFSLPNMISIRAVRRKKTEIDFSVIDEAKWDVLIQLMRLDGGKQNKGGQQQEKVGFICKTRGCKRKKYTGKESLPKKGACRAPFITKQSSFNGPDAGLSISIH